MRRRGLIRWNFPFYLAALAILFAAYVFLGLSGHIKTLLAQRLSALNAAPVVIEDLKFSLNGPRLEMKKIHFYDAHQTDRPVLRLHQVRLNLDWEAFLRNRVVVTEGQVSGVELLPLHFDSNTPPQPDSSIAVASDFLVNPSRGALPEDAVWKTVPSVQATQGLQSEIDNRVSDWQKQLDVLQKDLLQQTEDLKQSTGNETHTKLLEAQIQKSLVELTNLEARVKADGNVLLGKIGTLGELVGHDITVVRQSATTPNLEFKNLNQEIGGRLSAPLMSLAEDFQERLLPWLLAREQDLEPRLGRMQGTDFTFEGRLLPPRLWIKKLEIVSQASPDGTLGDALGKVQDLSSEPHQYPALLSLQASFPKAEVTNVQIEASIDHRDNAVQDKFQLNVADFSIRDLDFAHTPTLRLGIAQASAQLNLEYVTAAKASILNLKSGMTKVMFRNETTHEPLKAIFDEALAPLTSLDIEATGQGPVPLKEIRRGMHWTYASNLNEQLRLALQKTVGQEIAEFQARIKERAEQNGLAARKALETKLVTESEAIQNRIASAKDEMSKGR